MNVTARVAGLGVQRTRRRERVGDGLVFGLCVGASLLGAVTILAIAYEVVTGAEQAISRFGLGFIGHTAWKPGFDVFGAATLLYGTAVSSFMALLLAAPLGVGIGLYLSMLAPGRVRGVVGPLVETLAAIPSVILGFWGLLVLAPFVQGLEPSLHDILGFLPVFGTAQTNGASLFTAGLVLTIMVVPIIASISRDLFLNVPGELQEGAAALGATRWEVMRGVVLPTAASGVIAAAVLGLGRALGEAIAVTQVDGGGNGAHANLFQTGDTLASRIANQFGGSVSTLHTASLFYLALMLLVIGLLTNLFARVLVRRFDTAGALAR